MQSEKTQKGVALIMALSVVLLLSIALMKTFENRTIETVHLANSLQRFEAETLSRSVFRAVLLTIKTKNLLFIGRNREQWQGFPIPLNENQYFQIDDIRSIDHLFNLNRRFRADDPWDQVFLNNVNQAKNLREDPPLQEYTIEEIRPLLSALNDWTDLDSEGDSEFLYNHEHYYDAEPEFEIKNRKLDRLSEIKLIPPFQELGLTPSELKERFRIYDIGSADKQSIDVNFATPEETELFLEQFRDVIKYPNLYDSRYAIRSILEDRDEELRGDGENLLDPDPRFQAPLFGNQETKFKEMLRSAGVTLNVEEQGFFSTRTGLLAIRFAVTSRRVTVNTESIVELEYSSKTGSDFSIKSIKILEYSMQ